jgi:hypothetical protein
VFRVQYSVKKRPKIGGQRLEGGGRIRGKRVVSRRESMERREEKTAFLTGDRISGRTGGAKN